MTNDNWNNTPEVVDSPEMESGLWREKFNEKQMLQVLIMKIAGAPDQVIATELGVSRRSLRRYFDYELKMAKHVLNARVAGAMYKNAISGNFPAQKWWSQMMMGWKEETTIEHKHYVPKLVVTPPAGIDINKPMFTVEGEDDSSSNGSESGDEQQ